MFVKMCTECIDYSFKFYIIYYLFRHNLTFIDDVLYMSDHCEFLDLNL